MQDFGVFFRLGWHHIADWNGYDHMLFLTALCISYRFNQWKNLLFLVTAFTLGHSLTLAVSVYHNSLISTAWIEFLIPITMVAAAIGNLLSFRKENTKNYESSQPCQGISQRTQHIRLYLLTLFFGLIHGMGFSNYLRSLLGKNSPIVKELLAFNLGLECGQLLIVLAITSISYLFVNLLKLPSKWWVTIVSTILLLKAIHLCIQRFPI